MYYEMFILGLISSLFIYILLIPILKGRNITQTVRSEGPTSHYSKNGTPIFGGVIFVFCTFVLFVFYSKLYHYTNKEIILLLFPLVFFALIGFLDDGLIVWLGKNNGLKAKNKLIFQIIGGLGFSFILKILNHDTSIRIFDKVIELGEFYYVLVTLIIVSSTNAFNLTDGIDGLSGGSFIISMVSITFLSYLSSNYVITAYSFILIGTVLGYLCFNYKKASIFMGDSGSLSLGAIISALFIILKMELLILFAGVIYIIETLSVIIQVIYFKLTKGKRIFKMTPIHHHFELVGLTEMKIDYLFWLIQVVGVLIAIYLGIKYYI